MLGTRPEAPACLTPGDAETDEQWLQVIPYTVIRCAYDKQQILCYRRSPKCGEDRLAGKYSIGIGGHVDLDAVDLYPVHQMAKIVLDAALREINEEVVTVLRVPRELQFRRILRFNSTPVDRVHLGFVFSIFTHVPAAVTEDPAIGSMFFAPQGDLYNMSRAFNQANGIYGEFEGWSHALLKSFADV
jgi:predicted NUDIX family phosphoesterase